MATVYATANIAETTPAQASFGERFDLDAPDHAISDYAR